MAMTCDPVTGACLIPSGDGGTPNASGLAGATLHYVGDPMCSWCWGMSPVMAELAHWCRAAGLGFRLVMGGLRAGGGDEWNTAFRTFLRREWSHIAEKTGQPFGMTLLDRPVFDYDTEPACRAVVTARLLLEEKSHGPLEELAFFSALQRKFYVQGDDPKEARFYGEICRDAGLDPARFARLFSSGEMIGLTAADFQLSRALGCRAFPSLILTTPGKKVLEIAVGHATPEAVQQRVLHALTTVAA
jgi:putative protein-disulfide isomerase